MSVLSGPLRKSLEAAVKAARRAAEKGSRAALKALAVDEPDAHAGMSAEQRKLRNRLRVHGRQLGDEMGERRATQSIDHLVTECAYEHWHRLLFARFLADNGLLIEPENNVAISLAECRDLARGRRVDPLVLASSFAERMLPQIFRTGDPVLEVQLPPETRQDLERLVEGLAPDVFTADDSLGWTYQFWQADRKKEVNDSGVKIGVRELPAVTQLFTEDYMVLFLLHNTLGAWWTAKRKAEGETAKLAGYEWTYLRLLDDGSPAAGAFDGWPKQAKNLKVLDPSMGSGHFLVFALPILVAFRMEDEGLSREDAVDAVLRDNLFGLEIDPRCTQIAAFNLALAAWRLVGYRALPQLNLACSGLGINAKEEDWLKLAGRDGRARETLKELYALFQQAPMLGSLIEPKGVGGDLFLASFASVEPLLVQALSSERVDTGGQELAVAAQGIARAASLLASQYTLVVTNVPYLVRGKQNDDIRRYCERYCAEGASDLATVFLRRCRSFGDIGRATYATVSPQNWTYQKVYRDYRVELLRRQSVRFVGAVGSGATATASWDVLRCLSIIDNCPTVELDAPVRGVDTEAAGDEGRAIDLRTASVASSTVQTVISGTDARLMLTAGGGESLLRASADSLQGIKTGDDNRLRREFWEVPTGLSKWVPMQSTVSKTTFLGGMSGVVDMSDNGSHLARKQGMGAWGRPGAAVSRMRDLATSFYWGTAFDSNVSAIVAKAPELSMAVWEFCSTKEYSDAVRKVDKSLAATNASMSLVPFSAERWGRIAAQKWNGRVPLPMSDDPTQWCFHGHPSVSGSELQVALAILLGFEWPVAAGHVSIDPEGAARAAEVEPLRTHKDDDGIVCLPALKGEAPAAARLRDLLAAAFGKEWSAAKQAELLAQVGFAGLTLEDWLQDGFFEQHCELFHQRPFVWHVWDGIKKGGFSALVNYHKLAGPDGQGRRTLEALIYSYLGDWITQQRAEQKAGTEGADARVAAAEHLKGQLEKIREGAPPFDIFVRWKPLHEQAIGWEPDIDDGVRLNIRPFVAASLLKGGRTGAGVLRARPKGIKWENDRGTEPERSKDHYPWFWGWDGKTEDFSGGRNFDGCRWNDLHYSKKAKNDARARSNPQHKGKVA